MRHSRGIALILVLFLIALASIVVLGLTHSSYLAGRLNQAATRSLQAEYLLKSAINVARAIIGEDTTPEDSMEDLWAPFMATQTVDAAMLGLSEPGLRIQLEITPEESKFPIREILTRDNGAVSDKWRDAAAKLFADLGFDNDETEVEQSRYFAKRHFKAQELVAMLIDYMDADKDSYGGDGSFSGGFESMLPEDLFPNVRMKRVGELGNIPGFTPKRRRVLMPLLTVFGNSRININLAPPVIIQSLHSEITSSHVDAIVEYRNSQPFDDQSKNSELQNILGSTIRDEILTMIDIKSRWFQVIAKVDYGTSSYFMRAYLSKSEDGELPAIRSVELF
jgi:general secretion pathway protein K